MKPLYRNILLISIGTLLAALLIALIVLSNNKQKDALCNGVKITINQDSLGVLTEADVQTYFVQHVAQTTGKPIEGMDLAKIESQISQMPLVSSADCYIDNKGFLAVEVTEMIPVMHIFGGNHDYCVDVEARQIPTPTKLRKGVAIVEGANVSLQFATTELYDLILYIQQNGWSREFTEFRVGAGNKVSMRSNLYGYWVVFGTPGEYVRKFDKLSRFRSSLPTHTQYKEINLDYYGQVICK